jgi:hypothetical protein
MRLEDEVRAVDKVADLLIDRFDQVPAETVAVVVKDVHARFTASRIRDFIPILVERGARDQLTSYIRES